MSDERSRLASQSRYAFAPEWAEDEQDFEEQDPLAELARIIGDDSILAERDANGAFFDPAFDDEQSGLADDFDSVVQDDGYGRGAGYDSGYAQEASDHDRRTLDEDGYYEQDAYDPQAEGAWDDGQGADASYRQSSEYALADEVLDDGPVFAEGYDWPEEGEPDGAAALDTGPTPFPDLDDETFEFDHDGDGTRDAVASRFSLAGRVGIRPLAFMGAALLLVFLIGSTLFSMLLGDPVPLPDGAPPVIQADGRPYKISPDRRTADADEPLGQAVYDRVAGTEARRVEQIAPRAEKPVLSADGTSPRVISTRRDPQSDSADMVKQRQTVAIDVLDSPAVREKQALIGTSTGDDQGADDTPVVGGRRVRTVIVQSAGAGQTDSGSSAGERTGASQPLQVAAAPTRPTVLPKSRPTPVSLIPTAGPAIQPSAAQVARADNGSGPVNLMMVGAAPGTAVRSAASPPSPVATPAMTTSIAGGHVVQLTARRSEEQAREAFVGLKRRFPSILGPYQPNVLRADLGDRGIYYRVRIGPMSQRSDAISLCERLKSAGGDCLVLQN